MDKKLTIGQVAAACDVNVETIRFYQRRGLVAEPPKPRGFRYYDDTTVARVRFIKRAQALGFSLEEIKELLTLENVDVCSVTHDAVVLRLRLVEEKIADLKRLRTTLKTLVQQCESGAKGVSCPIIESLLHPDFH